MTLRRARLWCICVLWGGCFGGPISDFPSASEGEKPSAGVRDPNAGVPGSVDVIGDHDPDEPGGSEIPPALPGTGGAGDSSGDGSPGQVPDDGEFTPQPSPQECGVRAADGSCQGALCGVTRSELQSMVTVGGACVTDTAELALVCDESLARVVGKCTESALAEGSLASVQACATADPALDGASDDCITCYVQDNECMLSNCLVDCILSGANDACQLCRHTHCAEAFSACSGLPSQPMLVAPASDTAP